MNFRKINLVVSICFLLGIIATAQDNTFNDDNTVIYAVVFNSVPDSFPGPLIGCLNIARGSHNNLQLGFVNYTHQHYKGLQGGYFNTVLGNTQGAQLGFVNTSVGKMHGLQGGFINTTIEDSRGLQAGFVNTVVQHKNGAQFGYVNTALDGIEGFQAGFVNVTTTLNGMQVGFVNVVDSLEAGIPMGFLSIVRKGGYRTIEIGVSERYPVNLAYKIGVKQFYTTFNLAYTPYRGHAVAVGGGVGSIMPLTDGVYFNPELISMNRISKKYWQTHTFLAGFGFELMPGMHLLAAPSIVWDYSYEEVPANPFLPVYSESIDRQNAVSIGFRASLRLEL